MQAGYRTNQAKEAKALRARVKNAKLDKASYGSEYKSDVDLAQYQQSNPLVKAITDVLKKSPDTTTVIEPTLTVDTIKPSDSISNVGSPTRLTADNLRRVGLNPAPNVKGPMISSEVSSVKTGMSTQPFAKLPLTIQDELSRRLKGAEDDPEKRKELLRQMREEQRQKKVIKAAQPPALIPLDTSEGAIQSLEDKSPIPDEGGENIGTKATPKVLTNSDYLKQVDAGNGTDILLEWFRYFDQIRNIPEKKSFTVKHSIVYGAHGSSFKVPDGDIILDVSDKVNSISIKTGTADLHWVVNLPEAVQSKLETTSPPKLDKFGFGKVMVSDEGSASTKSAKKPAKKPKYVKTDINMPLTMLKTYRFLTDSVEKKYDGHQQLEGVGLETAGKQVVFKRTARQKTTPAYGIMQGPFTLGHVRLAKPSGSLPYVVSRPNASEAFLNIVRSIINTGTFSAEDYSMINPEESADVNKFIRTVRPVLPAGLALYSSAADIKELRSRYQVLLGELTAGNNSTGVKDEMIQILQSLRRVGYLGERKVKDLIKGLQEL